MSGQVTDRPRMSAKELDTIFRKIDMERLTVTQLAKLANRCGYTAGKLSDLYISWRKAHKTEVENENQDQD